MPTIWEQVEELARQGKGAVITFSACHEVKFPKGPPGRPRSRLPFFMGYAYYARNIDPAGPMPRTPVHRPAV